MIFLLHLIITVVTSLVFTSILIRPYKKFDINFAYLLAAIIFFIPGLGLVIALCITAMLFYLGNKKMPIKTKIMDTSININLITPIKLKYGAGGARIKLLSNKLLVEQRSAALFSLIGLSAARANLIMQELLPDTQDEIRLLAFTLLEQQEEKIAKSIKNTQQLLKKSLPDIQRAKLEKNLAFSYWELIYRHLLAAELQNYALSEAKKYAEKALSVLKDDSAVWILIGKIYLLDSQIDKAETAFMTAKKMDAAKVSYLPYLAEISFDRRHFNEVKNLLSSSEYLINIPVIGPVVTFWTSNNT